MALPGGSGGNPPAYQRLPVTITFTGGTVSGGQAVSCTVTVDSAAEAGTTVSVTCDRTDILTSPNGLWPYVLAYNAGDTTATFTITTQTVQSNTQVLVGACRLSTNNCGTTNWDVSNSITVTP